MVELNLRYGKLFYSIFLNIFGPRHLSMVNETTTGSRIHFNYSTLGNGRFSFYRVFGWSCDTIGDATR
jgi:hypothetical protein